MAIHRQFTASCDFCDAPFTGDGRGYSFVVNGVAKYSDELKQAMKQHGWKAGNQIACPNCVITTTLITAVRKIIKTHQERQQQP